LLTICIPLNPVNNIKQSLKSSLFILEKDYFKDIFLALVYRPPRLGVNSCNKLALIISKYLLTFLYYKVILRTVILRTAIVLRLVIILLDSAL
jgi:hypothetical protein